MRKKFIFFLVGILSVILVSCGGVKVDSVTISGPSSGYVGDKITLAVTVLPEDAKDKKVTWSSSDNSIATVIEGVVTLVKKGTVTITAKASGVNGTHEITVNEFIETESLTITGRNNGIVGEEIILSVNILPANATNKDVVWSVTDSQILEVDNGKVTLKSVGEALVIVKQGDLEDYILITVNPSEVATTGIEITGPDTAEVGDELTLKAEVLPANATNKNVTWGTTNSSVATVDSNGVVTIIGGGVVEISARQGNRIIAYHEITVTIETESILVERVEDYAEVGDVLTLAAEVVPSNAVNKTIDWKSSDNSIAMVVDGSISFLKAGEVTITAYQGSIETNLTFTVYEEIVVANDIIIEADANDGIVGDELNILARIQPANTTFKDLTWSINNTNVGTLEDGVVTLVGIGKVTITVKSKDTTKDFEINVYSDLDYIWNKFRETRRSSVKKQSITQYGNTTVTNELFPSIFPYRFNDDLVIDTSLMLPDEHPAHPNMNVKPEWIVVHDTGNINSDARAQAVFMQGQGDVSWQYSVGNDGVYQSLADNKVSWHASSGSTRTAFTDTGIPAVNPGERVKMTLSDGYYVIKGIKTSIKAPANAFVDTGMWPVIINGTYHIPDATERGGRIGLDGGNYEGIGIETSVYAAGDVFITWHRTAKLISTLLVNNNLSVDRIVFHNNFNNKTCPQTAIRSGNIDNWVEMMLFEYMIYTKFSDYTFELTPVNTEFLDNTGRVIGNPSTGNYFDYILKITDPNGNFKEQTFRTTIA